MAAAVGSNEAVSSRAGRGRLGRQPIVRWAVLFLAFAWVSCLQDFISTPKQPLERPSGPTVLVIPGSGTLTGATFEFRAVYRDQDGNEVPDTKITWASLNPAVATVDSTSGVVTGIESGQVTIAARAGNVVAYALATVAPPGARSIGSITPFPAVTGQRLNALWGASPADVFAAGSGGTLLRFDGTSWTFMDVSTLYQLSSLWGTSASDVFAVGDNGLIFHFDGTSWTVQPSQATQPLAGVWGASPRDVFAVGAGGAILHYDGAVWTLMTSPTTRSLGAVWGTSATNVYAAGDGGTIVHYDGKSWTPVESGVVAILLGVWGTSPSDVYAVGGGGSVLHFDGVRWQAVPGGIGETLYAVWGTSANDIWVAADSGLLQFDGQTWAEVATATGRTVRAVWGTRSSLFVAGDGGTLLEANRGGGARLVFASVPQMVAVGALLPVEVQLVDSRGSPSADSTSAVTLGIRSGPDSGSLLGTTTVTAHGGVATFTDVRIGFTATGRLTLVATAQGLGTGVSPSLTVFGAPARLFFLTGPPGTAEAGVPFAAIRVVATDSFGNVSPNFAADVTVRIGTNPTQDSLKGTLRQPMVNGIATFTDLSIRSAASGFTLVADASGVASATSAPLDVVPGPAVSVVLAPDGATIGAAGRTQAFAVSSAHDAFGNLITGRPVTWTSLNPAVGTIDAASGVASAVGSGQVTLRGRVDSATGYAVLTVAIPPAGPIVTWSQQTSGTSDQLYGVWGTSASDVFVVGGFGTILHFNGATWTSMASLTDQSLFGVWGASPNDVFAVGANGTILRYTGSWETMTSFARTFVARVWGASASDVYATSFDSVLHYNGVGWQGVRTLPFKLQPLYLDAGIWGTSPSNVYVVSTDTLYRYRGNDLGWDPVPIPPQVREREVDVWGTSPSDFFVLAFDPVARLSTIHHFDGIAWATSQLPFQGSVNAIWGTSSSDVYAVGDSGTILRYDGSAWSPMTSGTSANLHSVWGAPTGEVFVVGDGGVILKGTR